MTLTEEEKKELYVLSDIDCCFTMGDSCLSHTITALKNYMKYMKDTEDESISEVQKILNKIRSMKEENMKKWIEVEARVGELREKDL